MRSFEEYDEICKYFAEGKQRDNDANKIQKHLQLYNLSLGEYLVNKFALWLDFRMMRSVNICKDFNMMRSVNISLKESRETMMLIKFKSICNFTI